MTKPRVSSTRNSAERSAFTKKLAMHVKRLRAQKNITQEELADRAQLNSAYIGHLERGVYSPTLYVIWKIAKALGMSLEQFMHSFKNL